MKLGLLFLRGLATASILVATACQSATGIVATYRKWGNMALTVEVDERGYGRMQEHLSGEKPSGDNYSLVLPGGRTITIMSRKALLGGWAGEGLVVMDALDYSAWLERGHRSTPCVGEQGPFREAGETRIGQWTGTRYVLTVRPWTSVEYRELIILRRPDLAPLGRLLAENYLNSWKRYGMVRIPAYQRDMARLMAQGAPLKLGDNFTLISVERKRLDPARFRLPSRPLSRAELFRLLSPRPTSNKPPQIVIQPR
jgi:hypothetical protein